MGLILSFSHDGMKEAMEGWLCKDGWVGCVIYGWVGPSCMGGWTGSVIKSCRWMEGLQRIEPKSGKPLEVGSKTDFHFLHKGKEMTISETVLESVLFRYLVK